MDDLLSEKEQIDKMRTWWSDYGSYVIGGVVLGAAILFGINYYQTNQLQEQYAASALYDELADHVAEGRLDDAERVADRLATEFAGSSYASQMKLAMARLYMDKNRDQDASDALNDLLSGSAGSEFKNVARVRLSKILLYQGQAEDVVELLDGQGNQAFAARYAETLGDAYVSLERYGDARAAYQSALAEAGAAATVDQSFVQLKLLDLPIETFAATDEFAEDGAPAQPVDDPEDEPAGEPGDEAAVEVSDETASEAVTEVMDESADAARE